MQADLNKICNKISKEKDIDLDLLKAISNSVFKELASVQKNPPNLILNLKGIGRWFLRKQQMERKIEYLEEYYKYSTGEIPVPIGKYWENKELKESLERLLLIYDDYLLEKKEIRDMRLREGYSKIVEINEEED